jgi:alpha-L-rhamnosidase
VAKARLYITGLGMYAATVNGQPVGDAVLEPGQTTYSAEVDYRTYDLTRTLTGGTDVLGLETGSGAYQRVKTPGRYFFGGRLEQYTVFGEPRVIAQLEITYADGRRQTIASDDSWRTAVGPRTFSSWWSGEEYDARRSDRAPDAAAKLDGAGWQEAGLVARSSTTTPTDTTPLKANPRPPVTVTDTIQPKQITPIGNGSYILDFGANRSGWPAVHASGPAGRTITMIPSELLNDDGSLNVASTGAGPDSQIAYRYTFAGTGEETWHPQFTYSGFRYLQVDGLSSPPDKDTVTMQVTYTSNAPASSFESSNELLGVPTPATNSRTSTRCSRTTTCRPTSRNMATAQRQPGDEFPGLIANIAPEFHRVAPVRLQFPQGTIEFLDEVNWGGAIIRIPWQLYLTYGDTRTMAAYYDNMVKWLDYEAANKAANNGDIPGLGDWSATDNTTPMQLAIIAGYYTAANDMSKIAGVLGKTGDQAKYSALAQQLSAEFKRQPHGSRLRLPRQQWPHDAGRELQRLRLAEPPLPRAGGVVVHPQRGREPAAGGLRGLSRTRDRPGTARGERALASPSRQRQPGGQHRPVAGGAFDPQRTA